MRVGGFQKLSLSDFPGRCSAIVFTQGCNFLCPFCHNGALIPTSLHAPPAVEEERIFSYLEKRSRILDGVVISGGEPTIHDDLPLFAGKIRSLGLQVKLDTNGSRPELLRSMLEDSLLDYISMDIKAPFFLYDRLCGIRAPIGDLKESIGLIAGSGIEHDFRTTVVPTLLSGADVTALKSVIPPGSIHRIQIFRPENAFDPALRTEAAAKIPGRFESAESFRSA